MSYYYLATSYSRHPGGLDAAFRMACDARGMFVRLKIPVFSPIVHSHPIAMQCDIDPLDHSIWLPDDQPMMEAARGIVVLMDGDWEKSIGIRHEIDWFERAGKPVLYMHPGIVPIELVTA